MLTWCSCSMILERTRPSIYLPSIMFLWGIVTICMAWVQNYHTLVALRLIVGILESGFAPGILLILSSWYKPNEQSKRFALYISAAILSGIPPHLFGNMKYETFTNNIPLGAFGGLIAGAITSNLANAHGIRGWRWLFVVSEHMSSMKMIRADFLCDRSRAQLHQALPSLLPLSCPTSRPIPKSSPLERKSLPSGVSMYLARLRTESGLDTKRLFVRHSQIGELGSSLSVTWLLLAPQPSPTSIPLWSKASGTVLLLPNT